MSVLSIVRLSRFRLLSLLFYSLFPLWFPFFVSVSSFVPPSSFSSSSFPFAIFLLPRYPYPFFVLLIPRFFLLSSLPSAALSLSCGFPLLCFSPPPLFRCFCSFLGRFSIAFLLLRLLFLAFLLVLLSSLLFLFSIYYPVLLFSTLRLLFLFLRFLLHHGFFLSSSFPPSSAVSSFLLHSFSCLFLYPGFSSSSGPFSLALLLSITFGFSYFCLFAMCSFTSRSFVHGSCGLWFHFRFSLFSPSGCIPPRFLLSSSLRLLSTRFFPCSSPHSFALSARSLSLFFAFLPAVAVTSWSPIFLLLRAPSHLFLSLTFRVVASC